MFKICSFWLALSLAVICPGQLFAQDEGTNPAQTIATDPHTEPLEVPVEILRMRIKHKTAEQLTEEADYWTSILQDTIERLNDAKVEVFVENERLLAAQQEAETRDDPATDEPDPAVEKEIAIKDAKLDRVEELREQRARVVDRLNVVIEELSLKLGMTPEGEEQETVQKYRLYVAAVKGVEVDTSDWQALQKTVVSWLVSEEGGIRLGKHLLEFIIIVIGFWLLSILLGKLAAKAMALASDTSNLLRKFVTKAVKRVTIIVGILLGLAALEVNIVPLVAVIGATGFVIAFALQDTLSNFASGLMIMFYKPFDVGDFVETSEVSGKIRSMTLVTTNVMTPDNKLMVVPNNDLWGKVITNVTGSDQRRIDMVFGIGYDDDIDQAETALKDVVAAHPKILDEPEPIIHVHELADSSVNLICRPWVKTEDYWDVYWDITKAVKVRFDTEGISIPFPQTDMHVYSKGADATGNKEG